MLDVIAMMGTSGDTPRMYTVADTPSTLGMMMSIKIRSNRFGSWLILFTASSPSFCKGHQRSHPDLYEAPGPYRDFYHAFNL